MAIEKGENTRWWVYEKETKEKYGILKCGCHKLEDSDEMSGTTTFSLAKKIRATLVMVIQ